MRRILPLFLIFALLISGSARAEINAAGALTLKRQVEDSLQWRVDMAKAGGQGLTLGGPVTVIPKKDSYWVTLPHVVALIGRDRGELVIGDVTFDAKPSGTVAGAWDVQATLPSSMALYDAGKKQIAAITIGKQQSGGTWWPDREIWPVTQSLLENIEIVPMNGNNAVSGKIASIRLAANFKDNADNTWSGPVDFEATGIALAVAGVAPSDVSIAKAGTHIVYDRLDMSRLKEMRANLEAALKKKSSGQTDAERDALGRALLGQPPIKFDNMSSVLTIDKLLARDRAQPGKTPKEISFDTLSLSSSSGGATQEKSTIATQLKLRGFRLSGFSKGPFDALVPQSLDLAIVLDNLPTKKIAESFFTILQKAASEPPGQPAQGQPESPAQAEAKAALANLPKTLQDAGTTLTIRDTSLESAAISATADGKFIADSTARSGAAGNLAVSIKGLDEFLKQAQTDAMSAGGDMRNFGMLGMLMGVDARGTLSHAADGKSLRNYAFELTKEGSLLLNGAPLNGGTPATPGKAPAVAPTLNRVAPAPVPAPQQAAPAPKP